MCGCPVISSGRYSGIPILANHPLPQATLYGTLSTLQISFFGTHRFQVPPRHSNHRFPFPFRQPFFHPSVAFRYPSRTSSIPLPFRHPNHRFPLPFRHDKPWFATPFFLLQTSVFWHLHFHSKPRFSTCLRPNFRKYLWSSQFLISTDLSKDIFRQIFQHSKSRFPVTILYPKRRF